MTDLNSDIIVKIQKVLALSSNNPSIEEGQTAMLLAQKLMIENNLTMSDVSATEIKSKEVTNEVATSSKRVAWWHQTLSGIIADNFKCYIYVSRNRYDGITNIKFVGLKNDVEIAKSVYLYAIDVITQNYKKYVEINSHRADIRGLKNNYIFGYMSGLKDKFAEQIKSNSSWALIVVKDPVVDKSFEDLHLKSGGKRKVIINGNEQDKINGYKDGKNFEYISGKLTEE